MDNHHQTTLPFDLDDALIDLADPSVERPDAPAFPERTIDHHDPAPTYPKLVANALRPRPSSKHTLAAFPPGKAADAAGDVEDSEPAPLLLTIPQAGRILGLGRTTMYELIGADEIEVVHIGRAARIPLESVEGFVVRLRSVSHPSR